MTKSTFTFNDAANRIASHMVAEDKAGLASVATTIAYLATHWAGDVDPAQSLAHLAGGGRGDIASNLVKQAAAIKHGCLVTEVHAKGNKAAHADANRIAVTWRKAVQLMAGVAAYKPEHMREDEHAAQMALGVWCEATAKELTDITLPQAESKVLGWMTEDALTSVNAIKTLHKAQAPGQRQTHKPSAPTAHEPAPETEIVEHGAATVVSPVEDAMATLADMVNRAGAWSDADKQAFFAHMVELGQAGLATLEQAQDQANAA